MEFEKARSRRSFLTGLGLVGAAAWLHDSDHIAARSLRSALTDGDRELITPRKPDWRSWQDNALTVSWLGHATVLVNFEGFTILTDPVLMDWVGLDLGPLTVGEKRLVAPALKVGELPPLDLILLSHAHMDHMDLPTLEALPKGAEVITAANTTDLVRGTGHRNVRELRWGARETVRSRGEGLEVTGLEVNHWGARWKRDTYRGYNGYLLTRNGRSLVFGGDTAMCPNFREVKRAKPAGAVMPIGSYGRSSRNHCTPEEAVKMVNDCGADFLLPVHHSTFPLGKEPLNEPLERAERAIEGGRMGFREAGEVWVARG